MWMKSSQIRMRSRRIFSRTTDCFPCFLLVSRGWDIFSGIGPCFLLAAQILRQCRRKTTKQRQPLLVQYKLQPNKFLSIHNYTPHMISWNNKNKLLNSNTFMALQNSEGRGFKPNLASETVPLKGQCHRFFASKFFHESSSPKPLK
jgi:hypothetical protein